MDTQYYLIKNRNNDQIVKLIGKEFSIKKESVKAVKQSYYDTFDLRLQRNNIIFYKTNSDFVLEQIGDEAAARSVTFKSSKQIRFWQNFPTSELQDRLKPILYVRALIMFAAIDKEVECYNIVDAEEKIVARISLETISVGQSAFQGKILILKPVKGYDKYYNKLADLVSTKDFSHLTQKDFINSIIETGNTIPTKYSTKLARIDNPQMSSSKAVRKLLRSLATIVKQNEDGLIKDIDTEFLHDFRVALRKTRSILSLLKEIFNQDKLAPFKSEITSLAKSTNKLRDYDVYLHNKDNYQKVLPAHLFQGLNHFFVSIKREGRCEHRKLSKRLDSTSHRKFINSWEELLENKKVFAGTSTSIPIINLACAHIHKRFKKVLKDGRNINKKSPDSDLHKLRIDCKKLRYLMEFFSGLFPREEIIILIAQLKKLQTCLGEFNDYSVQQIYLENYLANIPGATTNSIEMAATIGALITTSHQEKQNRRDAFFKIFKNFTHNKNIHLYKKIFKTKSLTAKVLQRSQEKNIHS